jgi:hypothetical protein
MRFSAVRPVLFLLFLPLFPLPLSAISVYDVVRLSQQNYRDDDIVRIIQATDSRFLLSADDAARLRKEGVTEPVLREMLSRPAREKSEAPAAKRPGKPTRQPAVAQKEAPASTREISPDSSFVFDEIVRLTRAGLSEETVLAYAKAHRGDLPSVVTDERLRQLRQSGVGNKVIRYLTAIDVRASSDTGSTQGADDSESVEETYRSSGAYPYASEESEAGGEDSSYNAAAYDGAYPSTDYACYYGDYPFYPYGSAFYAYPATFFLNHGDFFRRFPHRRRDFGNHRVAGGHHPRFGRPDFPRGRRGIATAGQGFRTRRVPPRDDFVGGSRQPRGPVQARRGSNGVTLPPRGLSRISPGPGRGASTFPGAAGRPAFSGPGPGAIARAPVARSGAAPSNPGRSVAPRR